MFLLKTDAVWFGFAIEGEKESLVKFKLQFSQTLAVKLFSGQKLSHVSCTVSSLGHL